jgi:hypothetical protein
MNPLFSVILIETYNREDRKEKKENLGALCETFAPFAMNLL